MNTRILRELIEKNTRVIIPDFGAFLVKDDGSGVFKPSNVTFSPFLRYNDGIVEDYIANTQKIGKDQAKAQLNEFTEHIKDQLQKQKKFLIEGLGMLQHDTRGSIQFTTDTEKESLGEDFPSTDDTLEIEISDNDTNIEAKQSQEELDEPKIKEEIEQIRIEPIPSPDTKADSTQAEKSFEPKKSAAVPSEKPSPDLKKEENKNKPKLSPPKAMSKSAQPKPNKPKNAGSTGKAILYGTLIGIGFVAVLASGWYLYSGGYFSSKSKEASAETEPDRVAVDTSLQKEDRDTAKGKFNDEFERLSEQIDTTVPAKDAPLKAKVAVKKATTDQHQVDNKISASYAQDGLFHIIAGSFRNADYAGKFATEMQSSGFNSRVIAQPSGMHAVSLGSFLTREQAADSMKVWKSTYPNLWILKQ